MQRPKGAPPPLRIKRDSVSVPPTPAGTSQRAVNGESTPATSRSNNRDESPAPSTARARFTAGTADGVHGADFAYAWLHSDPMLSSRSARPPSAVSGLHDLFSQFSPPPDLTLTTPPSPTRSFKRKRHSFRQDTLFASGASSPLFRPATCTGSGSGGGSDVGGGVTEEQQREALGMTYAEAAVTIDRAVPASVSRAIGTLRRIAVIRRDQYASDRADKQSVLDQATQGTPSPSSGGPQLSGSGSASASVSASPASRSTRRFSQFTIPASLSNPAGSPMYAWASPTGTPAQGATRFGTGSGTGTGALTGDIVAPPPHSPSRRGSNHSMLRPPAASLAAPGDPIATGSGSPSRVADSASNRAAATGRTTRASPARRTSVLSPFHHPDSVSPTHSFVQDGGSTHASPTHATTQGFTFGISSSTPRGVPVRRRLGADGGGAFASSAEPAAAAKESAATGISSGGGGSNIGDLAQGSWGGEDGVTRRQSVMQGRSPGQHSQAQSQLQLEAGVGARTRARHTRARRGSTASVTADFADSIADAAATDGLAVAALAKIIHTLTHDANMRPQVWVGARYSGIKGAYRPVSAGVSTVSTTESLMRRFNLKPSAFRLDSDSDSSNEDEHSRPKHAHSRSTRVSSSAHGRARPASAGATSRSKGDSDRGVLRRRIAGLYEPTTTRALTDAHTLRQLKLHAPLLMFLSEFQKRGASSSKYHDAEWNPGSGRGEAAAGMGNHDASAGSSGVCEDGAEPEEGRVPGSGSGDNGDDSERQHHDTDGTGIPPEMKPRVAAATVVPVNVSLSAPVHEHPLRVEDIERYLAFQEEAAPSRILRHQPRFTPLRPQSAAACSGSGGTPVKAHPIPSLSLLPHQLAAATAARPSTASSFTNNPHSAPTSVSGQTHIQGDATAAQPQVAAHSASLRVAQRPATANSRIRVAPAAATSHRYLAPTSTPTQPLHVGRPSTATPARRPLVRPDPTALLAFLPVDEAIDDDFGNDPFGSPSGTISPLAPPAATATRSAPTVQHPSSPATATGTGTGSGVSAAKGAAANSNNELLQRLAHARNKGHDLLWGQVTLKPRPRSAASSTRRGNLGPSGQLRSASPTAGDDPGYMHGFRGGGNTARRPSIAVRTRGDSRITAVARVDWRIAQLRAHPLALAALQERVFYHRHPAAALTDRSLTVQSQYINLVRGNPASTVNANATPGICTSSGILPPTQAAADALTLAGECVSQQAVNHDATTCSDDQFITFSSTAGGIQGVAMHDPTLVQRLADERYREQARMSSLKHDLYAALRMLTKYQAAWASVIALANAASYLSRNLTDGRYNRINLAAVLFVQKLWRGHQARTAARRYRGATACIQQWLQTYRMRIRIRMKQRAAARILHFLQVLQGGPKGMVVQYATKHFLSRVKRVQRAVRAFLTLQRARLTLLVRWWHEAEKQQRVLSRVRLEAAKERWKRTGNSRATPLLTARAGITTSSAATGSSTVTARGGFTKAIPSTQAAGTTGSGGLATGRRASVGGVPTSPPVSTAYPTRVGVTGETESGDDKVSGSGSTGGTARMRRMSAPAQVLSSGTRTQAAVSPHPAAQTDSNARASTLSSVVERSAVLRKPVSVGRARLLEAHRKAEFAKAAFSPHTHEDSSDSDLDIAEVWLSQGLPVVTPGMLPVHESQLAVHASETAETGGAVGQRADGHAPVLADLTASGPSRLGSGSLSARSQALKATSNILHVSARLPSGRSSSRTTDPHVAPPTASGGKSTPASATTAAASHDAIAQQLQQQARSRRASSLLLEAVLADDVIFSPVMTGIVGVGDVDWTSFQSPGAAKTSTTSNSASSSATGTTPATSALRSASGSMKAGELSTVAKSANDTVQAGAGAPGGGFVDELEASPSRSRGDVLAILTRGLLSESDSATRNSVLRSYLTKRLLEAARRCGILRSLRFSELEEQARVEAECRAASRAARTHLHRRSESNGRVSGTSGSGVSAIPKIPLLPSTGNSSARGQMSVVTAPVARVVREFECTPRVASSPHAFTQARVPVVTERQAARLLQHHRRTSVHLDNSNRASFAGTDAGGVASAYAPAVPALTRLLSYDYDTRMPPFRLITAAGARAMPKLIAIAKLRANQASGALQLVAHNIALHSVHVEVAVSQAPPTAPVLSSVTSPVSSTSGSTSSGAASAAVTPSFAAAKGVPPLRMPPNSTETAPEQAPHSASGRPQQRQLPSARSSSRVETARKSNPEVGNDTISTSSPSIGAEFVFATASVLQLNAISDATGNTSAFGVSTPHQPGTQVLPREQGSTSARTIATESSVVGAAETSGQRYTPRPPPPPQRSNATTGTDRGTAGSVTSAGSRAVVASTPQLRHRNITPRTLTAGSVTVEHGLTDGGAASSRSSGGNGSAPGSGDGVVRVRTGSVLTLSTMELVASASGAATMRI